MRLAEPRERLAAQDGRGVVLSTCMRLAAQDGRGAALTGRPRCDLARCDLAAQDGRGAALTGRDELA
jgi:hypothetical protein